ncbi:hypothetical protein D3C75_866690 [compost metagenome]
MVPGWLCWRGLTATTGLVSVRPYPSQMAQPVISFQRSALACCRAMPPEMVNFSPEKSRRRNASLLHRATNRVLRPTKPLNFHLAISPTIAGRSRGLVISTLWLPISIIAMQ